MTAMVWAGALFVYGAISLVVFAKSGQTIRHAENRIDDLKAQRKQDAELIADLCHDVDMEKVAYADLVTRTRRISKERDDAIRQGQLAAKAGMRILANERDEFLDSLQAWMLMANTAVMALAQNRALAAGPKAIEAPQPLPSGEHFLVNDELLLQVEDFEVPAGARGTVKAAGQ